MIMANSLKRLGTCVTTNGLMDVHLRYSNQPAVPCLLTGYPSHPLCSWRPIR
jgi:hypothetical protein